MRLPIFPFFLLYVSLSSVAVASDSETQTSKSSKISGSEAALRKCVATFWEAWQKHDYQLASQYVLPEQRERFMRIKKFPVRKWEIVQVKLAAKSQKADVRVKIERFEPMMGSYFIWEQTAAWIRSGTVWRMQIPEARLESH